MKVLITIPGVHSPKIIDAEPNEKIGLLIKNVQAAESNKDTLQDFEITIKDHKEDLDKGLELSTIVKNQDKSDRIHLLIHRCKKVKVTVTYSGRTFSDTFPSSFSMKKVQKKVFKEFGIHENDGNDLFFWINDQPIHNIEYVLLGGLTQYPVCSVELKLGTKQDINGFKSSEEIFKEHIESDEFQLLELLGKVIQVDQKDSQWPFFYLRFSACLGRSFVLRFNLTDYPKQPPNGVPWDLEKNQILIAEKWPRFNPRCCQIFKPEWNMNGLYLPLDRIALNTHNNWGRKYATEKWRDGDTILKYVSEVSDALNRLT